MYGFDHEGFRRRLDYVIYKNGNQSSVARDFNMSHTAINNYLRGKCLPTIDFIASMCQRYDADLNWLVYGKTKEVMEYEKHNRNN